ncbi:MAG TPA: hypothetical protein VK196_15170 [Magnetospirillum sp.]|nr:hypothetical protein [Magnetospirillum sp.]
MAQSQHPQRTASAAHCHDCRFWFERCCHALALLEGASAQPSGCTHFTIQAPAAQRTVETLPW